MNLVSKMEFSENSVYIFLFDGEVIETENPEENYHIKDDVNRYGKISYIRRTYKEKSDWYYGSDANVTKVPEVIRHELDRILTRIINK